MSTALSMRTRHAPDRTGWLGAASLAVALASVTVTIAVTSGDDSPSNPAPAGNVPAAATHAHPLQGPDAGETASERFHHFR